MLSEIIKNNGYDLSFTILEIGARPIGGKEPFHRILNDFPSSRIIAFDTEPELCDKLNNETPEGIHYYPYFIGRYNEERTFYNTIHPMCSSLYKPNEQILDHFQNIEVAKLKSTETVKTVSLDQFVSTNNIGPVDFIKIDIQGAELEVFKGGETVLQDTISIVSEVAFVEIYEGQPVFGDVSKYLKERDLTFVKFLGLSGRTMKPFILKNKINFANQHLWSDAIFIRDYLKLESFDNYRLLKGAWLMDIYCLVDMAYLFLKHFDQRNRTNIAKQYMDFIIPPKKESKFESPCEQPMPSGEMHSPEMTMLRQCSQQ